MPPDLTIAAPDPEPIRAELVPLIAQAKALQVVDVASHALALESIKVLRGREKQAEEAFEPARKSLDDAKRKVLAIRDGLIRPCMEARLILGAKCNAYEDEQRRIAEEQSRRIAEEQRKREEQRQLEEAVLAEAEGRPEEAEAMLNEPQLLPVVHVAPAVAKVEGVSSRTLHSAALDDPFAFILWLAQHPEETAMLYRAAAACGPVVNSMATRQREAFALPGWRLVKTTSRAARTA